MTQPGENGANGGSLGDFLLLRIIHLGVVAGQSLADELAPHELSPTELSILLACRDRPQLTAVMIAQVVPIDTPSVSRSVHQLVRKGLMARRRSTQDRRHVRLRLTSEGEQMVFSLLPRLNEVERQILRSLDEKQVRAYRLYTEALFAGNFPRVARGGTDGYDG